MELILVVGAPAAVAVWVVLWRRHPNVREAGSLLGAGVMAAAAAAVAQRVARGDVVEVTLMPLVAGADLALRADPLGALFAALSSGLWVVTTLYSIGYLRGLGEHAQARYYFFFALCLMAAGGVALAANLPTFLVFFEILTFATWPLVVHHEDAAALRSGRRYLAYTVPAGLLLLLAVVATHHLAGTTQFREGGFLAGTAAAGTLRALFVLFAVGVGVKAAVMPLHAWLPAAMVAPTPVSALLHAVAVVKAGVFGILRVVVHVFGPDLARQIGMAQVLAWFAAATIVASSLLALAQNNLKLRLAYSTIGQLSYIVLGAAAGTRLALAGAAFHIVAHAFLKITLFFCAGAFHVRAHKDFVSQLDGLGRQMPLTMAAFGIGALGLAGFPPMVGFWSKWYLAVGAGAPVMVGVLVLSALLNLAYLFPIVWRGFLRPSPEHLRYGEASWAMVLPIVVTAVLSVAAGVAPRWPLPWFELAARVAP